MEQNPESLSSDTTEKKNMSCTPETCVGFMVGCWTEFCLHRTRSDVLPRTSFSEYFNCPALQVQSESLFPVDAFLWSWDLGLRDVSYPTHLTRKMEASSSTIKVMWVPDTLKTKTYIWHIISSISLSSIWHIISIIFSYIVVFVVCKDISYKDIVWSHEP